MKVLITFQLNLIQENPTFKEKKKYSDVEFALQNAFPTNHQQPV